MYVAPSTLDSVLNYLAGHNEAMMGGLLVGFREWLVVRLGAGNSVAWTGLVKFVLKEQGVLLSDEQARIEGLFVLLEQYFEERAPFSGLFRIYLRYERWLRTQDWYEEDDLEPVVGEPLKN